jgi:hypothetical protein
MINSQQGPALKTKRVMCSLARIVGIIGLFLALWVWVYGVQAITENPKVILPVIFIGFMMVGGLIDCVRVGREGIGGMLVMISGIVLYLFLLIDFFILKHLDSGGHLATFGGTLMLFLAGLFFYSCGRRRKKLKLT